ncbi:MAG: lysophospholipid acyltransferase family protein [Bryobacterales bacterium]|nr:lysophospholipid acyltransferase family protein [Bryobacterales bacterium]
MRERSSLRNALEYWLAACVLRTLETGPGSFAGWLARRYVWLLDAGVPRLRRTALRNLSMALPELDAAGRKRVVDGVFRSIARLLVAFARFPRIDGRNVGQWIRCEGREHLEEGLRLGRGVLVATGHLGNWELSAFAHALMTGPMYVVARPLDNPRLDALVARRRALSGNRTIQKKDFARGILKALAANQVVGVLVDQNSTPEHGVFTDFFGIPACTNAGFARLAAHSGAAVIVGCALWSEEERRCVLRFYPRVEISGDPQADTQRLQRRLEDIIRKHPDQWLWIHRRWKTRPPGEAPLYE